jgi:hypothetical protein
MRVHVGERNTNLRRAFARRGSGRQLQIRVIELVTEVDPKGTDRSTTKGSVPSSRLLFRARPSRDRRFQAHSLLQPESPHSRGAA